VPHFDSGGLRIHYRVEGRGPPLLMIHGFTSSSRTWYEMGWVEALSDQFRLLLVDCRGRGQSEKPHNPEAYGREHLLGDCVGLLDYLGIDKACLMGYSMGGTITLHLLFEHPNRFYSAVIGGAGDGAREWTGSQIPNS